MHDNRRELEERIADFADAIKREQKPKTAFLTNQAPASSPEF